MIRERIADDIYVFTSQRYAQVTAGAILTQEGVVLIDTLFYPDESLAIKAFIEERLGLHIRYLINTHHHADHTMGNCVFANAHILAHTLCRELLDTRGRDGLVRAQEQQNEFENVDIVLPHMLLGEGEMELYIGGKTLRLQHMPGHSPDLLSVYVVNDGILFASDNVMPVPTIFDGSYTDLVHSLEAIRTLEPDCVVQGHGEVVLRGEVDKVLCDDLNYLVAIHERVKALVARQASPAALEEIDIESCGKSRVLLNGAVTDLHYANLHKLYDTLHAGADKF